MIHIKSLHKDLYLRLATTLSFLRIFKWLNSVHCDDMSLYKIVGKCLKKSNEKDHDTQRLIVNVHLNHLLRKYISSLINHTWLILNTILCHIYETFTQTTLIRFFGKHATKLSSIINFRNFKNTLYIYFVISLLIL